MNDRIARIKTELTALPEPECGRCTLLPAAALRTLIKHFTSVNAQRKAADKKT